MIYPSIDKLLNIFDSKYVLVHIAAKRSREIKHTNFLQMPNNIKKLCCGTAFLLKINID